MHVSDLVLLWFSHSFTPSPPLISSHTIHSDCCCSCCCCTYIYVRILHFLCACCYCWCRYCRCQYLLFYCCYICDCWKSTNERFHLISHLMRKKCFDTLRENDLTQPITECTYIFLMLFVCRMRTRKTHGTNEFQLNVNTLQV